MARLIAPAGCAERLKAQIEREKELEQASLLDEAVP
jgi:hypothetical protein